MKTIRNITTIVIILTLVLSLNISNAQERGHKPPPIPGKEQITKMINELSTALSLTDTQKKEVEVLFSKHFEEAKKEMEKQKEAKKKDREKMEALRKSFESKLFKLLSDEQSVKFKKFMKNKRPPQKPERR